MLTRKRNSIVGAAILIVFVAGTIAFHLKFPIPVADQPHSAAAIAFFDRAGLPLGTILPSDGTRAASVPLERVAPSFLQAVIASEDARFLRHRGVDALAFSRAFRQLIESGRAQSGASTITMQLARMLYHIPSTWKGKLREIWLAERIESGSTKSQILSAYVNRLPMGGNLYGVESAARAYFGESADELDLAQSALLAAIPNDPPNLNPRSRWSALKSRQQYVLQRMVATGYVTAAQARVASGERIDLAPPTRGWIAAPHLLFDLAADTPLGVSQVQTTIDRGLQQYVEAQLRAVLRALADRNVGEGAVLVIDNATGDVLAYVGSADYTDLNKRGQNDGVLALRQPGSALKPFLYELALERGDILPNTILADVPTTYAVAHGQLYAPADYSNAYAGPVRIRAALANSLNVPAVRVLSQVGTGAFLDRLHELGFVHLAKPPEYYGLGLTLGGGEVSLWELTHAYLTIARRGSAIDLRTTSASPQPSPSPVGSSQLWSLITDILSDSTARARSFGVASILDLPFATAVKTGTSSDYRDTWTVGFSARYTVGVWVGNFNGAPMRHVSGVTGAAPVWNRIMLHLHETSDPPPFAKPPGMVWRPICATTGRRPNASCPAVVYEYLFPSQLASYDRPASAALSREYDEWLAMQKTPASSVHDVRILFPHEGDTFLLNRAPPEVIRVAPLQAIQFQARTLRNQSVVWRLNGRYLATTTTPSLMWPLQSGKWQLEIFTAGRRDSTSFSVSQGQPHLRRGFSM
ncbi:MAG: penicillin-binding protein 1C [Candidatus Eremiobacteraeota bacterium]|nr:penicillin-binding protein 1C [Candidatus Eremiobacteraeota bacterium]